MMTCHHGTNKLTCRMCAHELDRGRTTTDPRMYVEGLLADRDATIAELVKVLLAIEKELSVTHIRLKSMGGLDAALRRAGAR